VTHVIHEDPATRSRWWRYFWTHPWQVLRCAHRGHPETCEHQIFERGRPLVLSADQPVTVLQAAFDVRVLGERRACACGFHDTMSFRVDLCDQVADHMVVCETCRFDALCATSEAIRRLVR
jgi:hypothetical protein